MPRSRNVTGMVFDTLRDTDHWNKVYKVRVDAKLKSLRSAIKRLINCPDLNLEELEPETIEAIQNAEKLLKG